MNKQLDKMRLMEIKLLIIEYNKASQLDRSFSKTDLKYKKKMVFRKKLIETCIELMKKIDNNTLKNIEIRNKIKELKNIDNNISYGQAQKVVNVCLKQYCFIVNNLNIIKELDCPLDTTTMKECGIKNKKMIDVNENDYINYQDLFEREKNIRILKDIDYDEMRINNFLNGNE